MQITGSTLSNKLNKKRQNDAKGGRVDKKAERKHGYVEKIETRLNQKMMKHSYRDQMMVPQ